MKLIRVHFLLLLLLAGLWASGQEKYSVEKSTLVKSIDGREYYIHEVREGNTLYSISKVYDLPVEEIYFENPETREGLKVGQTLRLPVVSRDEDVLREVNEKDFNFIFHVVKKGETLYGISQIYDVNMDDLKELNPEASRGLKTGQYLKVPVRYKSPDFLGRPDKFLAHEVKAGETLYSISKQYGVDTEELREVNPGLTPDIDVGRIIYIPYEEEADAREEDTVQYRKHTVEREETLYGIALQYKVSIDSIRKVNPGLVEDIYAGQVLNIPDPVQGKEYIIHTVQKRTRLRKIAGLYDMRFRELKGINPFADRKVSRGEVLKIPVEPLPVDDTEKPAREDEPGIREIPDKLGRLVTLDSIRCHGDYLHTGKIFKVAMMLPLYLEEVDSMKVDKPEDFKVRGSHKPFRFVQFYEGFLIAMDSLQKKGLNVELHVYDVDETISKTIQVLQREELQDMDLIVGPLFKRNFKLVSNFAKIFHIKIVNPLTQREEVLDHDFVFKVTPSRQAQLKPVENIIKKNHRDARIILVRNNKYSQPELLSQLRTNLELDLNDKVNIANSLLDEIIYDYSMADTTLPEGELLESIDVENILIYREFLQNDLGDSTTFVNRIEEVVFSEEGIEGIARKASIVRPNVIVAYSENKVFALELLTNLNEYKDTFNLTLIGLPEWARYPDMEIEHLLNLNVHLFSDSFIDYRDPGVKNFICRFRKKYRTEPGEYAYDGFDIGYYFLNALLTYGRNFENCIPYYQKDMMQNTYIYKHIPSSGFENQHWNIYTYIDYKPVILNEAW